MRTGGTLSAHGSDAEESVSVYKSGGMYPMD